MTDLIVAWCTGVLCGLGIALFAYPRPRLTPHARPKKTAGDIMHPYAPRSPR